MNKKICMGFVILLFISLFSSVIASTSSDPVEYDSFTDGFRFIINNDGKKTCTISGYSSDIYTNIIPNEINGYTVTRIGDEAFKNVIQITGEVTLPDTIISVGNEAFNGCTYLTKIKFGKNLKEVGDRAFANCTALEEVNLNNVEELGDGVFSKCTGFTSKEINMPKTLKKIGSNAFEYSNIESLTFTTSQAPEVNNDTFKNYSGKIIIPSDCYNYIGDAWSGALIDGLEMMGDLDKNGVVNANDAAAALDMYKYGNITDEDLIIADLNRDGKITANDAALILDIYKYGK